MAPHLVLLTLARSRTTRRDDSDHLDLSVGGAAVDMDDDEETALGAETEQNESVLPIGVIGIGNEQSEVISEGGSRLLERDTVLGEVGGRLAQVPLEANPRHTIQCMYELGSSQALDVPGLPNVRAKLQRPPEGASPHRAGHG